MWENDTINLFALFYPSIYQNTNFEYLLLSVLLEGLIVFRSHSGIVFLEEFCTFSLPQLCEAYCRILAIKVVR